jgi:hypothetical protein
VSVDKAGKGDELGGCGGGGGGISVVGQSALGGFGGDVGKFAGFDGWWHSGRCGGGKIQVSETGRGGASTGENGGSVVLDGDCICLEGGDTAGITEHADGD